MANMPVFVITNEGLAMGFAALVSPSAFSETPDARRDWQPPGFRVRQLSLVSQGRRVSMYPACQQA